MSRQCDVVLDDVEEDIGEVRFWIEGYLFVLVEQCLPIIGYSTLTLFASLILNNTLLTMQLGYQINFKITHHEKEAISFD